MNITFIFDRCRRSSAAATPVKYECDSKNLTCTFAISKILLTEKLTNGALVTPISGIELTEHFKYSDISHDCVSHLEFYLINKKCIQNHVHIYITLPTDNEAYHLISRQPQWPSHVTHDAIAMTSQWIEEYLIVGCLNSIYTHNILISDTSNPRFTQHSPIIIKLIFYNKANLRDLIAATGLAILLKLDLNRRFLCPCYLEIWWMTPKNKRASLLCYFKLFASFRSHWWIQIGVTVRKRLIWVKIDAFFSRVTLKFDRWPSKPIGHLFYTTSSFVQQFVAIGEFKLELQSGNAQSGSKATLFRAVWPWNLTDDLEKQ